MRLIISIALVALASARPMGDKGGKDFPDIDHLWGVVDDMTGGQHKPAGGIDQLWGVLAGMHDKGADKGMGGGDMMKAMMGMFDKKDDMGKQYGMEQFFKQFMDKKGKDKGGVDDLWGVLAGMHDKKKGGDMGGMDMDMPMGDHKEFMKKAFGMMVKHKLESGDYEGAMAMMAHAKKMKEGNQGMKSNMSDADMALKGKIFKIMLMNKMAKGDIDGIFDLMIMKKKKMSEMSGKTLSKDDVEEYAKGIFQKLVAYKMQSNDHEGLRRLQEWHDEKMKEKANGGMSDGRIVKDMFMKVVAMHKMKKGDMEGLSKIMSWVKKNKEEKMSGNRTEQILMSIFSLAKAHGMDKMEDKDMKEYVPLTMKLIDKLETFKKDIDHHQFLHLVDSSLAGKPRPAYGSGDLQGMLKKMLGRD